MHYCNFLVANATSELEPKWPRSSTDSHLYNWLPVLVHACPLQIASAEALLVVSGRCVTVDQHREMNVNGPAGQPMDLQAQPLRKNNSWLMRQANLSQNGHGQAQASIYIIGCLCLRMPVLDSPNVLYCAAQRAVVSGKRRHRVSREAPGHKRRRREGTKEPRCCTAGSQAN